jgi:translation initiation factor 4E
MSTLPSSAANAARNAINAVNAEYARKDAQADDDEGQELTLEDRSEEEMRTVFNDPTTFNVKVRILSFTSISAASQSSSPEEPPRLLAQTMRPLATDNTYQHPLYSPWTLWFDSPATKGRNLPATPGTPAVPQTPSGASGWMDDIKKVITFDSVEEFWG